MAKKEQQEVIPQKESINPHKSAALKYSRNEFGLINEVDYKYNADSSIDWEKMIPTKFIVLNKDRRALIESKYSRNFEELQTAIQEGTVDASDIDNSFKLILLAGYKEVAKLRGFKRVSYHVHSASPEYVSTQCTIEWIPNYETGESVEFSSLASAHLGSTKSFAQSYLETISENRSFVRAVRNYLNIHVVGFDELGAANPIEENQSNSESSFSATDPRFLLEKSFNELNSEFKVSWVTFAKHIEEKKGIEGATEWKTVKDVPKERAYDVIGLVKDQIEKKRAKLNS